MIRRLLLLGLTGLSLTLPAAAQIYMHRDANGNPVFTDRPAGGQSEPVPLTPLNEWSAPPPSATPATPPEAAQPAASRRYLKVQIVTPEPDATIRDNTGNLTVVASSEPALMPGHRYRLLINGTPAGEQTAPRFALQNLDRGSHELVVEIIDERGLSLLRSEPRSVHIKRMTLAQRRQVQPCQLADYGVRLECPLKDKPKKADIPFVPFI